MKQSKDKYAKGSLLEMQDGKVIFSTEVSSITHFRAKENATSEHCFVVFSPWGGNVLNSKEGGTEPLLREGFDVFSVQSIDDDWHQSIYPCGIDLLGKFIRKNYRESYGYGSSMGGYAAIVYAKQLGFTRILALSPQFTIGEDFDRRWQKHHKRITWVRVMKDALDFEGDIVICYDSKDPDAKHYNLFMENFKSANLVGHPVKFGSHPTTHYFHDGGKLKELLVRFSKGDFLTLPSVDRKRNKTYLRTLSAELLKRNKLSMAKSILLKALSLGDERNYSYRQLSNIMNRLEMYGDAAFYAQKATIAKDNTDNSRKDHTIHLANMLRLNGDLDQALCTIDAFLEVTPDWFAAYITKANILLARKATEEAKPVILKAMEFGEERNYSCRQLSNILNRLKMNEEAVVYARKAALAQDNTDNSRKDNIEHLANMERLNGDLDTALCTIDALIQEAPGRFSAYTTKANILLGSQARESAKSAFLKAIELGDERNYTYRQLSNLLHRQKVFDEALVYARKAALAQDNTESSRKDNTMHLERMIQLNGP